MNDRVYTKFPNYANHPYLAKLIKDPTDKRLHLTCKEVATKDIGSSDTFAIIDALKHRLKESSGIGLAACQLGINRQIIVVYNEITDTVDEFINPKVIEAHETNENMYWSPEGCLSHPGVFVEVARPRHIIFKSQRLQFPKPKLFKASGMIARVIQHEVDHLNGILLTDKGIYGRNYTFDTVGQKELSDAFQQTEEHGQKDWDLD